MALQYARPRCVSTESPCSTSYRVVPQRVVHQRHQRQCVWGASAQQHTSRSLIVRSAAERDDDEVPTSFELAQRVDKQKPLVKVSLTNAYQSPGSFDIQSC